VHAPTTSADLLIRALDRNRAHPAVYVGERALTCAEMSDQISRYVQAFAVWGLREGSRVAVLSANRPEVLFLMGANMIVGTQSIALHPLASLDDHAYILADAEVETLFYDPDGYEERAASLYERVANLTRIVALGHSSSFLDLPSAAAKFGVTRLRATRVDPTAIRQIGYTGGTTGRPKGVVITDANLTAMTAIQMAEWQWPDKMRFLCATPLSHAGQAFFIPTLLRGGTLIVQPRFDPDLLIDAIDRYRVTSTMLVPTMIYGLLDYLAEAHNRDLSSLQTIYYGASAISPTRLAEGLERLGPIFFQFYGQVECPMTISVLRREQHLAADPQRLASCGKPVAWLDVALLDDEGQPTPAGQPGEICVRGPLVMREYLNQPEQTAQAFRYGWLHTGDIARADDEGYLSIVDRKKDMVVTGGFNVFPREVEDALAAHTDVAAAAVFGVPHDKWGEAVKAVVVRKKGRDVNAAELIAWVKDRKGTVAAPKAIEFVDAIPLSALGKPDKKQLRARYAPPNQPDTEG
jgi:fatty-acyl-CoA synthase